MILNHQHSAGKTSYEQLKTGNGIEYLTYREACRELGLLNSDDEWSKLLNEMAASKMAPQLRELFVSLLVHCGISNSTKLFEEHYSQWTDDFEKHLGCDSNDTLIKNLIIIDISKRLEYFQKSPGEFCLPELTEDEKKRINQFITVTRSLCR